MRTRTLSSVGIVGLVGAAASIACGVTFSVPTAGFTAFTPYGSCSTDGYAIAAAEDCPNVSCPIDYYAICNGTQWVGCDCTLADLTSYTVISSPSFTGVPTGDGGPGDGGGGPDVVETEGGPGVDGAGGDGPPGQGDSGAPGDGSAPGDGGGSTG